jgi:hypothetical protein
LQSITSTPYKADWSNPSLYRLVLCFFLWFASGTPSLTWAQTTVRTGLRAWEDTLIRQHTQQYERARQLAYRHGWPIHKNYSSQRILSLQGIDPFGQPVYYTLHNREAAQGTHTEAVYAGGSLGISLSGSTSVMAGRLGMWDGGQIRASHQEFTGTSSGRVRNQDPLEVSEHATHVAGTLVASGVRPDARGMAYGAVLWAWDYTNDIAELTLAAPDLLVSNHAYGPVVGWVYNPSRPGTDANLKWEWWGNTTISATEDYRFGFYTDNARDLDRVAYNNPFFLMVRSADNKRGETGPPAGTAYFLKDTDSRSTLTRSRNDAYDVIPAEATAKNVLTIGAATVTYAGEHSLATLESTSFSGWGPTDDGRIKPDLLGMGTDIFSTLSGADDAYGAKSGTSMAAANVSGSLFLLQELYAQKQAQAGNTSAVGRFMRAATLRGLALHTATRLNPAAGPNYRQGWGLLNTEAAARVIQNSDQAHLILEQTLVAGGAFSQRIVAQGNEPLVITLCWTDPEGTATVVAPATVNSRLPKLVNDLDIRLTGDKTVDMPFILNPTRPDQAASRGDNIRDNVEQIYVANPVPGQVYTLSVTHKGKMTYSGQPYSLIISGLRRSTCTLTASISPANDTTLCTGTTLVLQTDSRPNLRYEWLRNGVPISAANSPVYTVSQAGAYALRVTDASGCSALSRVTTVQTSSVDSVAIQPQETNLFLLQGATVTLRATDNAAYTYQWYRNNLPIDKANQSRFSVSQAGVYKVRVSRQNCTGWSSARSVQMALITALPADPAAQLTIYPNPAESILHLRYVHSGVKQLQISLFDGRGVLVQKPVWLKSGSGQFETELPVGGLPTGLYRLHLSDGEQRLQTHSFLKK